MKTRIPQRIKIPAELKKRWRKYVADCGSVTACQERTGLNDRTIKKLRDEKFAAPSTITRAEKILAGEAA